MALLIYSTAGGTPSFTAQPNLPKTPSLSSSTSRFSLPLRKGSRKCSHVAQARKGLSSRSRRLEKRGKKGGGTTTTEVEDEEEEISDISSYSVEIGGGGGEMEYSTEPMPKLEGLETDFWEGNQWNAFGFFVQYMWAFGILFGLIACGIAVTTYNEGATDFKKTPVYKESIQSRELLEEPDASNSDVFEANPTEEAPSLE